MFRSLLTVLLNKQLLLLVRTRRRIGRPVPYPPGAGASSKQHKVIAQDDDDVAGYWEYWVLIPQQRQQQQDDETSAGSCMVLLQLCDEESFLVDALGTSPSLPDMQAQGPDEECSEYMEQCLQQIGGMDTYNPLAFPSGRYARADCYREVDTGKAATQGSRYAEQRNVSVASGGSARGTAPGPQDVRSQAVYGREYPPQRQVQGQAGGPPSAGTLAIKTTSSSLSGGDQASAAYATRPPAACRQGPPQHQRAMQGSSSALEESAPVQNPRRDVRAQDGGRGRRRTATASSTAQETYRGGGSYGSGSNDMGVAGGKRQTRAGKRAADSHVYSKV